jgi:hypothetical protein
MRMSDDSSPEPYFLQVGEASDDLPGVVRRYERSFVDIDQRLKDIFQLLRDIRADLVTDRDRIDQLERDFVGHRKHVDELAARRVKKRK